MIIKIKAFLTVHSGPQPVMVSGLGTNFPKQRHIGFPNLFAIHIVPGPHGDGWMHHSLAYWDADKGETTIKYRPTHQHTLDDNEQTSFPPQKRVY